LLIRRNQGNWKGQFFQEAFAQRRKGTKPQSRVALRLLFASFASLRETHEWWLRFKHHVWFLRLEKTTGLREDAIEQ